MNANEVLTRTLVLSPAKAQALLLLLDDVLARMGREDHNLADVHVRLSDSLSLSCWLRENVALHLHPAEVVELAEAIVVMLDEREWSDANYCALQAVVEQLSVAQAPTAKADRVANLLNIETEHSVERQGRRVTLG